jgi:hypothetical protein
MNNAPVKNFILFCVSSVLIIGCINSCTSPSTVEKPTEQITLEESLIPIKPGNPGSQPFWNKFAQRFIYAPAFEMKEVNGASTYRFSITGSDGHVREFTAGKPWEPLSPIWGELPEGYTTLLVEGLDESENVIGNAGEREFYRSPVFTEELGQPVASYHDAARTALKAIYEASNVQHWLTDSLPDRSYDLYCYPSKVIGGLIRAMVSYSKVAHEQEDRNAALQIAQRSADYMLSVTLPDDSYYPGIPPTYIINVDEPLHGAKRGINGDWFMLTSAIDAAFGFLDLFDATKDEKYFDAAITTAEMFFKTQEEDGTWPHLVNWKNGEPIAEQRLIPTWVMFFFDRLDNQYGVTEYRDARARAWEWTLKNPMKTYQWDGQFEDAKPRAPYKNLAREQACDIAMLLLDEENEDPEAIAQAVELLRFAEDQFVVWTPVKDCEGWREAITHPRKNCEAWITPLVLEQYICYDPVARSSAILINAYLKAHQVTQQKIYLDKARALANGLLAGQEWLAQDRDGNGLIPTWVMKADGKNWLNNSFYAAEAVLNVAGYESTADEEHLMSGKLRLREG